MIGQCWVPTYGQDREVHRPILDQQRQLCIRQSACLKVDIRSYCHTMVSELQQKYRSLLEILSGIRHRSSHSFPPGSIFVVPLEGRQTVALHRGEGVDDVRTQRRRHVLGQELASPLTVLRPVRVVTHSSVCPTRY